MSPWRMLLTILAIVFVVEAAVMVLLLTALPAGTPAVVEVLLDATLMTALSAPLLWWTIGWPLRRAAVTEQAKAESIVGAAVEGIITIDERGCIETFNRAAEGIFGLPATDAVGQDFAVLLFENCDPPFADESRRFLANGVSSFIGRTTEVVGRRRDGRSVPLSLSLTAIRVASRWLFTALVRDLTAAKRAEAERQARVQQQAVVVRQGQRALACDDLTQLLQETAQCVAKTLDVEFSLILELLPDGATLTPRAGVGWSAGLLEQTTWNVAQDSSRVGSLLAEEPVVVRDFCQAERYDGPELLLFHGVVSGMTVLIRHREQPFGVLGVYTTTPRAFSRDEIHFLDDIAFVIALAVQRKEAELKQRERDKLRAEHLATVAQMATGVAHELRNPLTAIKMLVQAGREPNGTGGIDGEDLDYIEQEIRRMERCLQAYLDFARPRKPERRPMDLATLVQRTLTLVEPRAAQQHVALDFAPPPAPVTVDADWEQIQQVLINLAFNALDAMPRGGRLEMELSAVEDGAAVRTLDSGPGIAPQVLPKLFQPFVTSKETGTGLGLVISRRIAEEHGGSLFAQNRPAGGACFELRLPRGPNP